MTACIGGLILLFLGGVMAGLVWLYRLGWGNSGDEDEVDEELGIESEFYSSDTSLEASNEVSDEFSEIDDDELI